MSDPAITIKEPASANEFDAYYRLRWEALRKPWDQPVGSEKDELEKKAVHLMALNADKKVVGVVRIHLINPQKAQLRYMAVDEHYRGTGVGKMLLHCAEKKAVEHGVDRMILQSRENALSFYQNNGYSLIEKSYLLWDQIQHYRMMKTLK